jgi:protein-S-isoprenylcysteine O-methyltransferase Ste14
MFAAVRPYIETHAHWPLWVPAGLAALSATSRVGRRRAGATRQDRGSHLLFGPCLAAGIALLILSRRFAAGAVIQPTAVAFFAGEVIIMLGAVLRIWSIWTLGAYFTTSVQTSPDQEVITDGPYRVVRHPSYTALLMMAVGAGLVVGNWAGLAAITIGMLVPLVYRIHVEEDALGTELGDAYRSFASTRKRLIPGVW